MSETSIVEREAAHFGSMAGDWWDPDGASAMLHRLNSARLAYLRERIVQHSAPDECVTRPLAGRTALDVRCGAGLLCARLARMGATVTGVDAAPELIEAARSQAEALGLDIDYRAVGVEAVAGRFDLVTAMEVIEHVAEPAALVASLAARLAPGGLLLLSRQNGTMPSPLMTITLAESFRRISHGTRDYDKFIAPERMRGLLGAAEMMVGDIKGIAFTPMRGLHLSEDVRLNCLVAAAKPAAA